MPEYDEARYFGRVRIPQPATVASVRHENRRTVTITLADRVRARPGQFAMLWLPGLDEKPFSLLSDDPLAFTIAAVGPFSRAIHRLEPGGTLWWRGPFGHGFDLWFMRHDVHSKGGDDLLVGGGYGVAPLYFAMRRLTSPTSYPPPRDDDLSVIRPPRVVVGARTADDVLLQPQFEAAGIELAVTTEDGSLGARGLVTSALRRLIAEQPPRAILACGPHGMLDAVAAVAAEFGVPAQLSWEAYMRCGIGICGSCEHGGMLLCTDGPVLTTLPGGAGS